MKANHVVRALLLVFALLAAPVASYAQAWSVGVSIGIAPPPMPVYVQPPCPAVGYLWTPGYWAYDPVYGYYWVPGTWVLAPAAGLLWTPGYWGFEGGFYHWHVGYWGPRVGFYGGVNYGFGYFGTGFAGGHWDHDRFFYNRSVTNVTNVSVTNVYNQTVGSGRITSGGASFNGGSGGIQRGPNAEEQAAARGPHFGATAEQTRHDSAARAMPSLRATSNHGLPPVAATPRPGVFEGHGVSVARGREAGFRSPPQATGHPGPSYAHAAPAPYREPMRAPAMPPAHAAPSPAPALRNPPARESQGQRREGGQGPRREEARVMAR
jgi:hypothetical protein